MMIIYPNRCYKILSHSLVAMLIVVSSVVASAQQPAVNGTASDPVANAEQQASSVIGKELSAQIQSLRAKVSQLESALMSQHRSLYSTDSENQPAKMKQSMAESAGSPQESMKKGAAKKSAAGSMGGMKKGGIKMGKKGMGMMKGKGGMNANSNLPPSSAGSIGMGKKGGGMMKQMGMMGRNPAAKSSMGRMSSMGGMKMPSALPGFPGASHLYHIGETGFFLDHPQHISLTNEQQLQLNKIKEGALLATATAQRNIDEAEQQLWMLTAEAQPDIKKIEAKSNEIGKLQAGNRIEFIRSVGKAAKVLTEDQRNTLAGMAETSEEEAVE